MRRLLTEASAWRTIARRIEKKTPAGRWHSLPGSSQIVGGLCSQFQKYSWVPVSPVTREIMHWRVSLFAPGHASPYYWLAMHLRNDGENFDCRVIAAGLLAAMADAEEPLEQLEDIA